MVFQLVRSIRGRTLMDIDIDRLSMELEKNHRLPLRIVYRQFPSTLCVEIVNSIRCLFFVFVVPQAVLRTGLWVLRVPFIKVVVILVHSFHSCHRLLCRPKYAQKNGSNGEGFEDLKEIAIISPLLELAQRNYPSFYRDWKVVSYDLENLDSPGAHIRVQSGKVKGDQVCSPRLCRPVGALALYFFGTGISQEKSHRIHQPMPRPFGLCQTLIL